MPSIKDAAKNYVPSNSKTVADLPEISVDVEIYEATKTDANGEEYVYSYIEVNHEEYRVPAAVLRDLKTIVDKNPNLKKFSVGKSGTGRTTKYTVIPMM